MSVLQSEIVWKMQWKPMKTMAEVLKLVKRKSFLGVWYQVCFKKIKIKQHPHQQSFQSTLAASSSGFPMLAIRPAGEMQLCTNLPPIHVWWRCFTTLLSYSPRFQNELSSHRSFVITEHGTCYDAVQPFPSIKSLLKKPLGSSLTMQSLIGRDHPRTSTISWYKMPIFCHKYQ